MTSSYAVRRGGDDLSSLTAKLAADLRDNIRAFHLATPLSQEWIECAQRISKVATIVETERKLNAASAAAKADGTLWEGEEWAMRYLLEDGKLNLCLRIACEYLQHQLSTGANSAVTSPVASPSAVEGGLAALVPAGAGSSTASSAPSTPTADQTKAMCSKVEHGIGVLLGTAWLHPEAVQTTDIPLAISILQQGMEVTRRPNFSGCSPSVLTLILRCWAGLGSSAVAVGESKLVNEMVRQGVFALLPSFAAVAAGHESLKSADGAALLLDGLAGAAAIISAEEFQSVKSKVMSSADATCASIAASAGAASGAAAVGAAAAAGGSVSSSSSGDSHVVSCGNAKKAIETRLLSGQDSMAVKRKIRPFLDYIDAAARRR